MSVSSTHCTELRLAKQLKHCALASAMAGTRRSFRPQWFPPQVPVQGDRVIAWHCLSSWGYREDGFCRSSSGYESFGVEACSPFASMMLLHWFLCTHSVIRVHLLSFCMRGSPRFLVKRDRKEVYLLSRWVMLQLISALLQGGIRFLLDPLSAASRSFFAV